jgi:hypothetical protein
VARPRSQGPDRRATSELLEDWIKAWDESARPFTWAKIADRIIDRICRYCSRITEPAH